MPLAPIALFVYNRLDHTRQTVAALVRNTLARKSDLIIYTDGPKNETAEPSVTAVRQYLNTINGFKSVTIIKRDKNLGLAKSIIDGVTETIKKYGKIIVLEDDLITAPFFLQYMNDGLNLYQNDETVYSVHGYIYPTRIELPSTFFSREINCWGWGTWERAWGTFEADGKKLLDEIRRKGLMKKFDLNYSYHYGLILRQQAHGFNNSWAIRWYASAFLNNKLGLHPNRSLVKNIGLDNSGSNTGRLKIFNSPLATTPIKMEKIEIKENQKAIKALESYFKSPRNLWIFQLMRLKNEIIFWTKIIIEKIK